MKLLSIQKLAEQNGYRLGKVNAHASCCPVKTIGNKAVKLPYILISKENVFISKNFAKLRDVVEYLKG